MSEHSLIMWTTFSCLRGVSVCVMDSVDCSEGQYVDWIEVSAQMSVFGFDSSVLA